MNQLDANLTPKKRVNKKSLFLDAFAEDANVMLAARAAGVSRQAVYQWLEHDEAFSLAFNQAKENARDVVRAEIKRRAIDGWDEDVHQLGKYAGKVHKYSDTLLIFHAKMLMPEYREKQQIEHSGPDGRPIQTQQVEVYKVRIPDNDRDSGGSGN